MRILVAEDERITRTSLVRQLEGWGHTTVAAEDGEEAWEKFQSGGFDLVITDWEMPRRSGVEFIRQIRAAQNAPYVYVLLLTSRTEKGDVVSGIEAGADDFVSKPFDKGELKARLLAGERVVRLERTLSTQNDELRAAGERMRRDLNAAARVQKALLPRSGIETARARAAFSYVPTDELAGDALGFQPLGDRFLVGYIVDVAGHGVPAALLAVTVMHALSATGDALALLRNSEAPSPSRVAADFNRRFLASDNDGRFLTMLLCVLDTSTGVLTYARAGHPLPIIVRAGGEVGVSDEGGLPLGLVEDAGCIDVQVQLAPGDRVYLYSDGFLEQYDPPKREHFGVARLGAALASGHGAPGEETIANAVGELRRWAGGDRFTDDASIVMLEWLGA